MEIERKWLLAAAPLMRADKHGIMEQFYVSLRPEVRLRKNLANEICPYRMAIKGEGDLSREEIQTPVTEDFYRDALLFIDKPAIKKEFFIHYIDNHEICTSIVDQGVFLDVDGYEVYFENPAFIYAEVEFNSEDEAMDYQFPWPELIIREVTYDSNYKMKNYWERTRC